MKEPKTKKANRLPKAKYKKPDTKLPHTAQRMMVSRFRQEFHAKNDSEESATEQAQNWLEQGLQRGVHEALHEAGRLPQNLRDIKHRHGPKVRDNGDNPGIEGDGAALGRPGGDLQPEVPASGGGYSLRKKYAVPSEARRFRVVGRSPGAGEAAPLAQGDLRPAQAGRILQQEQFGKTFTVQRSVIDSYRKRTASDSSTPPLTTRRASPGLPARESTFRPCVPQLSFPNPVGPQPKGENIHRPRSRSAPIKRGRVAPKTAPMTVQPIRISQQNTVKHAVQAGNKTVRGIERASKTVAKLGTTAVRSMSAALLGGGGAVLVIFMFIAAVAALIASPFGILFSEEEVGPEVKPLALIASETSAELEARIKEIRLDYADANEFSITYNESENNTVLNNWPDVIGVFAVKTTMADDDAVDVITLDPNREARLKAVFWDMTLIDIDVLEETRIQQIENEDGELEDETYTYTTVKVTVTSLSHRQAADLYDFTPDQRAVLRELLQPDFVSLLMSMTGVSSVGVLTSEELAALKAQLAGLSMDRQALVEAALSLVGRVNYFWGGKSAAIGWDDRWGTLAMVTAAGSKTTGTMRPFGMDCSGFTAWCFNQIGVSPEIIGYSSWGLWEYSLPVQWKDAQPGDIVLFCVPGTGAQHVGIIVGEDDSGQPLVAHCNASRNTVTVDGAYDVGFLYVRRFIGFL